MKDVAHIVTTNDFNNSWMHLLRHRGDAVYETYLGFYLKLRDQLNEAIENPNTFGFMINTGGFEPAKSGVVCHRYQAYGWEAETAFKLGTKQNLLGLLEDHDLDFQYQKLHEQIIQPMPDGSHMAVMSFYTPHKLAFEPEIRGSQLEDFAMQPSPSYQFYKLMNQHDNRVFAFD